VYIFQKITAYTKKFEIVYNFVILEKFVFVFCISKCLFQVQNIWCGDEESYKLLSVTRPQPLIRRNRACAKIEGPISW
jgi:hypothetical protein